MDRVALNYTALQSSAPSPSSDSSVHNACKPTLVTSTYCAVKANIVHSNSICPLRSHSRPAFSVCRHADPDWADVLRAFHHAREVCVYAFFFLSYCACAPLRPALCHSVNAPTPESTRASSLHPPTRPAASHLSLFAMRSPAKLLAHVLSTAVYVAPPSCLFRRMKIRLALSHSLPPMRRTHARLAPLFRPQIAAARGNLDRQKSSGVPKTTISVLLVLLGGELSLSPPRGAPLISLLSLFQNDARAGGLGCSYASS
ncbi:hypothetical protein B0H19DRAFT_1186219 [Mycena capillaripes]|nr:hypothetical protein B0H19DRAFT_1186219 [Mycena capillaripes]